MGSICHIQRGTCFECIPGWIGVFCETSKMTSLSFFSFAVNFYHSCLGGLFQQSSNIEFFPFHKQNVKKGGTASTVVNSARDIVKTTLLVTIQMASVAKDVMLVGQSLIVRKVTFLI